MQRLKTTVFHCRNLALKRILQFHRITGVGRNPPTLHISLLGYLSCSNLLVFVYIRKKSTQGLPLLYISYYEELKLIQCQTRFESLFQTDCSLCTLVDISGKASNILQRTRSQHLTQANERSSLLPLRNMSMYYIKAGGDTAQYLKMYLHSFKALRTCWLSTLLAES